MVDIPEIQDNATPIVFKEIADDRTISLLDKLGKALVMIYNKLPSSLSFPKVQVISGTVKVKDTISVKVENQAEVVKHLKAIEVRLGQLTTAISMIDSRKNSIKKKEGEIK